jgi:uncharacterized protein
MRHLLTSGMTVVLAAAIGLAQQTSPTESPATKEDVETLFTTMHIREQVRGMMETTMAQMKQITHENVKKRMPNITQKELDRIDEMTDTTMKGYNIDEVFNDMIPIYQRHLSKADVTAMLVFYKSPTGKKLLREQPAMIAESMEVSRARMEKVLGELMDKVEHMTGDESQPGADSTSKQ